MSAGYRVSRRISRRLRLTRVVRETHLHSDIVCIPPGYHFTRPVLVPTAELLSHLPGVLLLEDFDFILCSSVLKVVSLSVQSLVDRSSSSLFLFPDELVAETFSSGLLAVVVYHHRHYPSATFRLLSCETAPQILSSFPDMLASLAASVSPYFSPAAFDPLSLFTPTCSSSRKMSVEMYEANKVDLSPAASQHGSAAADHGAPAARNTPASSALLAEQLFRAGVAARGTLVVDPHRGPGGVMYGEVLGVGDRILVSGPEMGGAMHGDEVYVVGNSVIGVARRSQRRAAGTVISVASAPQFTPNCPGDELVFALVRPVDRRLPDFAVCADPSLRVGTKVLIHISGAGRGAIVRRLREFDRGGTTLEEMVRVEEESLLAHFSVFEPAANLEGADLRENSGGQRASEDMKGDYSATGRVDLRSLTVLSVDPEGCADIDDALHCIRTEQGFEVGVHIADVSLAVPEDTTIDREARVRGTTVYLPGRRVDMLPAVLSSGICSLLPKKIRNCVSVIFKMDAECNILDTSVFRSKVATRAALSYEQAQAVVDSKELAKGHAGDSRRSGAEGADGFGSEAEGESCREQPGCLSANSEGSSFRTGDFDVNDIDKPISETLRTLVYVAGMLRARRAARGALILNDVADDLPSSSVSEKDGRGVCTHAMVEELMVLANASIADFIVRHCPEYSLLRRHPPPVKNDDLSSGGFERLRNEVTIGERGALLAEESGASRSIAREAVRRIVGRSMQQAVYFVSGEAEDPQHYGLALKMYTHFTSPIRRYADLVVHRIVVRIIEGRETESLSDKVDARLCSLLNWRTRNAKAISRLSAELHAARKLVKNQEVEAVVMENRCFVEEGGGESNSREFAYRRVADSGGGERRNRRTYLVLLPEAGIEALVEDKADDNRRVLMPLEHLRVRVLSDFWEYCSDREVRLEML